MWVYMSEYAKFIFKDFPTESVVHKTVDSTESEIQDQLIAGAVVQHLETIVPADTTSTVQASETHDAVQEEIDLTKIRAESYSLGYEEAKRETEPLIEQLKSDLHFSTILHQQLDVIAPKNDIDKQLLTFSVECIKTIADRLLLSLPVEFDKILLNEMLSITHKFYKEGQITIRVHTNRLEYSEDLIKSDARIKPENVNIVVDDNLGSNDCVVEWDETRLEYDQERIKLEIDRIFNQLQQIHS